MILLVRPLSILETVIKDANFFQYKMYQWVKYIEKKEKISVDSEM